MTIPPHSTSSFSPLLRQQLFKSKADCVSVFYDVVFHVMSSYKKIMDQDHKIKTTKSSVC